MQLPVVNIEGGSVGTLEVSDLLFGVPMNAAVVHQAMLYHRANARQGTASAKTRAMVSGGGAKPRPQKHTGRSRQGSTRSPQWRGGGVVFGPQPRSFRQRLPKKMRRLAIRCLLSDKVREDRLTLVQSIEIKENKTKEMKVILTALDATSSVLVVTPVTDEAVVRSSRNLPGVKTLPAPGVNVMDLLNHDRLVITVDAIRKAEELWGGGATPGDVVAAPSRAAARTRRTPSRTRTTTRRRTPAAEKKPATEETPAGSEAQSAEPEGPETQGNEA